MTDTRYAFYVGIDWASAAHQVVVLDHERQPVAERSVAHTGAALHEFAAWLATTTASHPEQVAIAIEVPRGAVVETLLERGSSSPSTPSNWTGFGIVTPWRGPRMIAVTASCWPIRWRRTSPPSVGSDRRSQPSFSSVS